MTVAVPCANCGADFEAGRGTLCPDCRPGGRAPGELRIPPLDGANVTKIDPNRIARFLKP